jgi:transcription elongation factor Elf1
MGKRKSSTKPPPKKVRSKTHCPRGSREPTLVAARASLTLSPHPPPPPSQTPPKNQPQYDKTHKTHKKTKTKAAPKLDTSFNCPFCNGARTVTCTIDLEHGLATARCGACGEAYQTQADHLTEPVDVMSDWLDACEADGGR